MEIKQPTYTINLTTFAYGGDSLGRLPDGRTVFIPFALPGETVRVQLVEEKKGHARGELLQVLAASPERIVPRCPHFGECGGCHYQHLSYSSQLKAKTGIVQYLLQRIGGLVSPLVNPAVPSPVQYNYRNHIQFHLTPEGKVGFNRAHSDQTFAVQECHLPEATLNQVWPQLDFETMPELERIGLRLGLGDDIQLILESNDPQPPEFVVEDLPISAVHLVPGGKLVLAGSDFIIMEVLGRLFRVSAGSFFQVNTRMAEAMVSHLLENLSLAPGMTALDIYCGVGLFSAFLAPKVDRLVCIEANPTACEDFVINLDEFDNVELYEAAAEEVLPHLDLHPEVIIVDPPRAGLARTALDAILRLQAPQLAYISCDPATLARDARRLTAGGYQLMQVTPFDLFPQTYHIESISLWSK